MYMPVVCKPQMCRCLRRPEGVGALGAGVSNAYELLYLVAVNQTQVLGRTASALNHLGPQWLYPF